MTYRTFYAVCASIGISSGLIAIARGNLSSTILSLGIGAICYYAYKLSHE